MEFTVDRGECRLSGESRGRGPVLLMIHGVGCDGTYFSAAADFLAGRSTVVTYDRRGYSKSPSCKGASYAIGAQAEDASQILRFLHAGPSFVVGCSAGGVIALELARRHPEQVGGLLLHEPPLGTSGSFRKELADWLSRLHGFAERGKIAAAALEFVRALGGVDPRAPKRPLQEQRQNLMNLEVFLYREMDRLAEYLHVLPEHISLSAPCAVAVGERDADGLFSKYGGDAARRLNCPLLHAAGYHNMAADLPLDFASLVLGAFSILLEKQK